MAMSKKEVAQLLTLAAAVDNRKLGPEHVESWWRLINQLDYQDAVQALETHYRVSDKWMMPVHIIQGVKEIHEERERRRPRAPEVIAARAKKAPAIEPVRKRDDVQVGWALDRDQQRVKRVSDPDRKAAAERELKKLRQRDG